MIAETRKDRYVRNGYAYVDYTALDRDMLLKVLQWRNNPDVRKWMYNSEPISEDEHLAYVERLRSLDDRFYWVMFSPEGRPLASLNLARIDRGRRSGEFGYYLASDIMHAGMGPGLLREMTGFLFDCTGIETVLSEIKADNTGALLASLYVGRIYDGSRTDSENGQIYYRFHLDREAYNESIGSGLSFRDILSLYRSRVPCCEEMEAFLSGYRDILGK